MPEKRWLVVNLEAPLMAFGGVTIDHIGVTRNFPALSMLTGFLGNALGYRRTEWEKHQALQDRLVFAVRRDRETPAGLLTDTQNAKLVEGEEGWTTWGQIEKRRGGTNTYRAPHRRKRDYHMDARIIVALRLTDGTVPDLNQLSDALDRPARPLFIGRKACIPSGRLNGGFVEASTAFEALQQVPGQGKMRALWPFGEGPDTGPDVDRIVDLPDIRNWRSGLHGGARKVVEGYVSPERAAA